MKKLSIFALSLALLGCGDNQNSSQNNANSQSTTTTSSNFSLRSSSQAQTCQYNFDATQQDYDIWNLQNPGYMPITQFPKIDGQRFGFIVSSTSIDEDAYVNYVATSKAQLNSTNNNGDFPIPTTGIIAFEMQLKIPTPPPTGDSTYMSSFLLTGVTNNGYAIRSDFGFQSGTYDPDFGENPPDLTYSLRYQLSDGTGPTTVEHYQNTKVTSNTNNYQRLGIYINQLTKQVGFIFNGVDQGYQANLPAALENLSFNISSSPWIYSNYLDGQELSSELITDRNALQFSYPQGTTDICGNVI
ncbi:DUF4882 domain-containing protein [Acinetobacter gyllenbergii]|uniref:DUF4882 domain-containing protein n=1 Tax=Acinetobacter gyllenbergii CIP 110306 = MTCC 11365 TaxID=1217657 RepID=A0A829HH51_9GAMM|nr:DUF4882 family protein [Acinetobacter gyllenbergii]EPF81512.1 hypothetical protein F957_02053 [Acinetobacter gyllenbergii CIP 110306 = MTCC 11365]EPH36147.1 hypothetical protein L293_0741 [Acinetobacter gyllenbergii CIP 110306 = MTCC 11365]GMA12719.1 DUF4882 domain-containing protein [Acinetobacter gyllenbergii]